MAKSINKPLVLRRLLEEGPEPCFAIDAQGRIAWCNEPCAALLGVPVDSIVGLECRYSSEPTGIAAIAAALCPPPELRQLGSAIRKLCMPGGEGPLECQATYILLRRTAVGAAKLAALDAGQDAVVLGWLAALPEKVETADVVPAADGLHAQLQELRASRPGALPAVAVGNSRFARRLRAQIAAAVATEVPVLLYGPPGSGRRALAEALPAARPGGDAARCVTIDAARMPSDQIHAALAQLAATGRRGTPVAGTLVLTAVDELSLEIQAEFERALDERRIGLRVVSTASAPLDVAVQKGRLREGLAMLLSTFMIELVSLGRRREDVPLVAQHLVELHNAAGDKQLAGFAPAAMERLVTYEWPGELQELSAAVAQAHRQATGTWIERTDLPASVTVAAAERKGVRSEPQLALDAFLLEVETELLRRAVARAKGNKAKAARLLGVTRPRLYRRLVQLGLEPPPSGEAAVT